MIDSPSTSKNGLQPHAAILGFSGTQVLSCFQDTLCGSTRTDDHQKPRRDQRPVEDLLSLTGLVVFPFANADPALPHQDAIETLFIDTEAARAAFTYVLGSGREGTIHVEQVLEYNLDPTYLRALLLYRLTRRSPEHNRRTTVIEAEIDAPAQDIGCAVESPSRQTNNRKSVERLIRVLYVLGRDVDLVVRDTQRVIGRRV